MYQKNFFINAFFSKITQLGSVVSYVAALLVMAKLDFKLFYKAAATLALVELACTAIKLICTKARPIAEKNESNMPALLKMWSSRSFPSLHSARAAALAVIFSQYYPRDSAVWAVCLAFALLISYSRVYLKKHDWADVAAGLAMGTLLGLMGTKF